MVSIIKATGLRPMDRQFVHLSTDETTAVEVGRRKTKDPTVLRLMAADAYAHGINFYEGNEKVWLADHVPPEFIVVTSNRSVTWSRSNQSNRPRSANQIGERQRNEP